MADEKLNMGSTENTSPKAAEPIATPEQAAASEPRQEQTGPAIPETSDVVVSFDKINELMVEKRQNTCAEAEKAEIPETPEKHRSPPIRRSRKSCAVVVRRKQKRPRLKNRTKMLFTASWTKSVPRESIITFIPLQEVPSSYGAIVLVLLNFCVLSHLLMPVDDF